ncbi:MAG: DUF523 domain-containing protein [Clostridia bacterium]|nr:DUF523 domain-containing protein [Clostridia bacterium]
MKILVSRCLLGIECRYDGKSTKNEKVLSFLKGHEVIGICPESDGGLPTPRTPSEIIGDKVVSKDGKDVTAEYTRGAVIALETAKRENVDLCILKKRSPSCGIGVVYDGTFSGKLVNGDGITAKLLKDNGFKVISEEDV